MPIDGRTRRRWLATAVSWQPGAPRRVQVHELRRRQPQRIPRAALDGAPIAVAAIPLPLGISFFTFHSISYVVDMYRRNAAAQHRVDNFGLYILLFPQLIAGPIIRYKDIAAQLTQRATALRRLRRGHPPLRPRTGQEGAHREHARQRRRSGVRRRAARTQHTARHGSASLAIRCRSISTSPAIPTWRSVSCACSAFASSRISTTRTSRSRYANSGVAGTFRCRISSATTCTFHWAATARQGARLPQSGARVPALRSLAWRELDFHRVGCLARRCI